MKYRRKDGKDGNDIGFPIFILFMWIMFEATFRLGGYPMEWIEALVEVIGNFVRSHKIGRAHV